MASIYAHKDANIRKTWLMFFVFFVVVIGLGWVISLYFGSPIILYVAVFISVVMSITSFWFSDSIVIKTTHAKKVEYKEYPDLYNVMENLVITAGLPMPRLYIVDDPSPNAFATGRDPEHAVVAVTSGLLKVLDRTELEGVLAHELSHIGNRDMLVSTVAVVLVGFVALLSDIFLRSLWFGGNRDSDRGSAGMILLVVGIALAILTPIIAQIMQLAISRKREFLADASGALLTRHPDGLASALQKIEHAARPMKTTNNAVNHLWLSDPDGSNDGRSGKHWFSKLFMTHPSVEDRIKALKGE